MPVSDVKRAFSVCCRFFDKQLSLITCNVLVSSWQTCGLIEFGHQLACVV